LTSTSSHQYATFSSQAQYDEWLENYTKKNEESLVARGIPIVDFRTQTPDTHLSTTFQCTSSLKGRLTPYPHSPSLYVLDFVSHDNKRFEQDTNLAVYDVGFFGEDEPQENFPQGSLPGRRGTIDLFILNPGRVCEIRQRGNEQCVKRISFVYTPQAKFQPRII